MSMGKNTKNREQELIAVEKGLPQIIMIRGRTTFKINIHYDDNAIETIEDKERRRPQKDVEADSFKVLPK